jgi:hypothetical protein
LLGPLVEQVFPEQNFTEPSAHSTCTVQDMNSGSGMPIVVVRALQPTGANIAAIGPSAPLASSARLGEARVVRLQQRTARARRNFGLMAVSFAL